MKRLFLSLLLIAGITSTTLANEPVANGVWSLVLIAGVTSTTLANEPVANGVWYAESAAGRHRFAYDNPTEDGWIYKEIPVPKERPEE